MNFLLSLLALTLLSDASANDVVVASLSGDQLSPPVDSTASGNVTFVYSEATESIVFTLDISNPDGLGIFGGDTGANLHCTNFRGQILIPLIVAGADKTENIGRTGEITQANFSSDANFQCVGTIPNLWTAMTTSLINVNVTSSENPEGELLAKLPGSSDVEGAIVEGSLSGASLDPPAVSTAMGNVTFVYSEAEEIIVYVMSINNPDGLGIFGGETGANLHCTGFSRDKILVPSFVAAGADKTEKIGRTGEIIQDSFADDANFQCVRTIPNLWSLMTRSGIYVNVTSSENPEGELQANLPGSPVVGTSMPTLMPTSMTKSPTSMTKSPTSMPSLSPTTSATSTLLGGLFSVLPAMFLANRFILL